MLLDPFAAFDPVPGFVHADAADEQVPIDQFEKAWGMYDHQLVIAVD